MRVYKIPKEKLNLFLIALDTTLNLPLECRKPDYVFQSGDYYDVIIPIGYRERYWINGIEAFVQKLDSVVEE